MARKNILESTEIAIESAALAEANTGEKKVPQKVTQKEGSKVVNLKKFPLEWFEAFQKSGHPGALTDYILTATYKQLKADGIL